VRSNDWLSVGVLILMTLAGAVATAMVARRLHRILSFRVFAIAYYTLVNVASGIAHILDAARTRRGFFDAVVALEPGQLLETSLIAALGLLTICLGVTRGLPRASHPTPLGSKPLASADRALIIPVIAVLFPISLWSLLKIQAYASTLDVTRVSTVSEGLARYVFLSSWFAPAVLLAAIWAANLPSRNESLRTPLVLLVAVVLIAASVQWLGGRSTAFFLSIPLVLVLAAKLRQVTGLAIASSAAIGLVFTFVALQQNDFRQSKSAFGVTGPSDWLDWELGRFSMLGFALQSTDRYGLLGGETFVESVLRPLAALSQFVGIRAFQSVGQSSTEVVISELFNSSTAIYVVPGLSAELFLNFGVVGIALGYFALGRVCGWVDDRFTDSGSILTQLAWAFTGTFIVKSIGFGGAVITTFLFTGAPLLVVAGASHLIRRQRLDSTANISEDGRHAGEDDEPARQPSKRGQLSGQ